MLNKIKKKKLACPNCYSIEVSVLRINHTKIICICDSCKKECDSIKLLKPSDLRDEKIRSILK